MAEVFPLRHFQRCGLHTIWSEIRSRACHQTAEWNHPRGCHWTDHRQICQFSKLEQECPAYTTSGSTIPDSYAAIPRAHTPSCRKIQVGYAMNWPISRDIPSCLCWLFRVMFSRSRYDDGFSKGQMEEHHYIIWSFFLNQLIIVLILVKWNCYDNIYYPKGVFVWLAGANLLVVICCLPFQVLTFGQWTASAKQSDHR